MGLDLDHAGPHGHPAGLGPARGALNLPVQSVCAQAQIGHGDLPRVPLVQAMVLAELRPPVSRSPLDADDCARLGG